MLPEASGASSVGVSSVAEDIKTKINYLLPPPGSDQELLTELPDFHCYEKAMTAKAGERSGMC